MITTFCTETANSSVRANTTSVAAFRGKKRVYCEIKCTNASTELDQKVIIDVLSDVGQPEVRPFPF